jgi:alanine racemase
MSSRPTLATWVEVDSSAIESNTRHVVRMAGVPVMAVVKANGYGHGAVPSARAALHAGAIWCGVARASEAHQLRQDGLSCPILLLGAAPVGSIADLIAGDVSLAAWNADQFQTASAAARSLGKPARLHLKVDTGMGRIGVQPDEAVAAARQMAGLPGIEFEGVFTHFARADETDTGTQDRQERMFREVVEALAVAGMRPRWVHAANSAATLTRPGARFNMVRVGIALYGLEPSEDCSLPDGFRPALVWRAQLSQVKDLRAGQGVGYGHTYVTRGRERIGTIPVGYADGYRRVEGNVVLVEDAVAPVVGRVCMDQIMVQLDRAPNAHEGDTVTLIGEQGGRRLRAEDVARRWGTINYEVVCGISARVPRIPS